MTFIGAATRLPR